MTIFALALGAFLATQAAGLQTLDMVSGAGDGAAAGDRITLDYTGNLLSGKVFDSSSGRAPLSFTLGQGQVIKGFDQGLLGVKAGGRRILSIPPELGYGDRDLQVIPPKSTLIFDIKVLQIEKKDAKAELVIEELAPGTGTAAAKMGDKVTVKYKGTFLNGVTFDEGTHPFTLGDLIKGFNEGVVGMKIGQKRKLTIPPSLGYGERGTPNGPIPPNATLIFEVELVKIGE